MLINVRISELISDTSNSIPSAILVGILFNVTLYKMLPSNLYAYDSVINSLPYTNTDSYNNINHLSDSELFLVTSQV